ncbi:energy coupling factor transporter S component ThiW, partial [Planococcus sp. A6]
MNTKKLVLMAMFVALAVAGSAFVWFPAGIARAYPVQHAINVIAAVVFGPGPAVV